jgi:hypothetical protein
LWRGVRRRGAGGRNAADVKRDTAAVIEGDSAHRLFFSFKIEITRLQRRLRGGEFTALHDNCVARLGAGAGVFR